MSIRVRIDNVTLTNSGTLNLVEAKYSMEQITYNNFTYSMTENQKDAYALFINGNNVNIFLATIKLQGVNIPKGTNITSLINKITIIPNKVRNNSNNSGSTLRNGTQQ